MGAEQERTTTTDGGGGRVTQSSLALLESSSTSRSHSRPVLLQQASVTSLSLPNIFLGQSGTRLAGRNLISAKAAAQ